MTNKQENHNLIGNSKRRTPEAHIITSDGQVLKVMLSEPESKRIMGEAFRRTVVIEGDAALVALGGVPRDLGSVPLPSQQLAGAGAQGPNNPDTALGVKIARAYMEGAGLTELVCQYGLEMNQIVSFVRVYGVRLRRRTPTVEDLSEMRRLYEHEERSSIEIGSILGYSEASIRVQLRKMGVRMRRAGHIRQPH